MNHLCWKFVLTIVLILKTVRSFYTLTIQITPWCTEETSLTRQELDAEHTICVPFFVSIFSPWFIFAKRLWTCPFCDLLGIVRWLLTTGSSWIIRTPNCQWFANIEYMLWLFVVDLSPRTSNWSALWLTPLIQVIGNTPERGSKQGECCEFVMSYFFVKVWKQTWISKTDSLPSQIRIPLPQICGACGIVESFDLAMPWGKYLPLASAHVVSWWC